MLAMNWITPRQQGGLLSSACSVEGDYRYLVWRQFYEKAKLETRRDGNEYQLQSDKSSVCVFCSCLPFLFVKALVLRRARFALEQGVLQIRTSWRIRTPPLGHSACFRRSLHPAKPSPFQGQTDVK